MNRIVVVGSGAGAVHAALALVERGASVLMVDVGHRDDVYTDQIPAKSFEQIRIEDPEQHRYLLGDDFEGIPLGPVRVGAQLTPPRQHISRGCPGLLPADSEQFQAMHSLALGGLAAGWGAATPPFIDGDMQGWPITRRDLQYHYDTVTERIGICGSPDDDIARFLGPSPGLLPPAPQDSNAQHLMRAYARKRFDLRARGFHAGHPRLAMATKPVGDRGPLRLYDMEFWADKDRAVYRPVYTLEELRRNANFEYRSDLLVEDFQRQPDGSIIVRARNLETGTTEEIPCAKLVLGAGAIGTARIVLHALRLYKRPVPILSNPYTYYPSLVWSRLGKATTDRRHSLTQMMIYQEVDNDPARLVQGQVYSYRSLLTFKLVKESPLPHRESIALMRLLQSYFVILGIHHADRPHGGKRLWLEEGTLPKMRIGWRQSGAEISHRLESERLLVRNLRALGCIPIKRINPGDGSSIHYGGCFPMSAASKPLTTTPDGELRDALGVYIVDGAALPHLPAKGLTLTIMANARRIALGV